MCGAICKNHKLGWAVHCKTKPIMESALLHLAGLCWKWLLRIAIILKDLHLKSREKDQPEPIIEKLEFQKPRFEDDERFFWK